MRDKRQKKVASENLSLREKVKWGIYDLQCALHKKTAGRIHRENSGTLKKSRINEKLFIAAVLFVPLTIFCVFYIGVNINSFFLAFQEYDITTGTFRWLGFDNFARFFEMMRMEAFMGYAWRNSFIFLAINLFLSLPFHIINAYYVYKKHPFSKTFRFLLFLPTILSTVVTVTMYKYFLIYGLQGIYSLFKLGEAPNLIYAPDTGLQTVLAYSFWVGFGGSIILFLGLMNRIPPDVLEAASIDGITPLKEFWYIILPLIFPTIGIYIVNILAGFFMQQGSLYTFFGGAARNEFYTFGYYYYIQVLGSAGVARYPIASAAGLFFTVITVPVVLFVRWVMNKVCPPVDY